ncbi:MULTISPECIES: hypothetical protein [Pseudomonadota]|jgi:hypothetical protein|uniref:hypothetical protein n=1 Tax=Pseudomonadota TaxID=1224 RepID=UPI000A82B30E|nr:MULTISPECIES: hypothetical protein [Pseudomonadota]
MNALTSLGPAAPLADWDRAQIDLHLWLGRCLDCFTQAESVVSASLLLMAHQSSVCVELGKAYLFGQKLQILRNGLQALEATDPKRARLAIHSLDRFQPYADLRNSVCHGASTLYLDKDGHWLVELKLTQLSATAIVTSQVFIDQAAAAEKLKGLKSAVQSLGARLSNLSAVLSLPDVATPSAPAAQASR